MTSPSARNRHKTASAVRSLWDGKRTSSARYEHFATAGAGKLALAQQPQIDVIGELANNEVIFVDGKTFKIARGKAKGDPAAQIAKRR
jgi:hypothetical protein